MSEGGVGARGRKAPSFRRPGSIALMEHEAPRQVSETNDTTGPSMRGWSMSYREEAFG